MATLLGGGWGLPAETFVHLTILALALPLALTPFKTSPLNPWILAWVLWNGLTVFFSLNASTSLRAVWVLTDGIVAFYIATNVQEAASAMRWPLMFLAAALPALAVGIGLEVMETGQKFLSTSQSLSSFFPNPNLLGGFLVLTLPIPWAVFLESEDSREKKLALGLVGLGTIMLALSGSRSALFFWLITLVLLYRSRPGGHSWKRLLFFLAMLIPLGSLVLLPKPWGSFGDRWLWWKAAWHMFLDHPVVGVGIGQFNIAYPLYAQARTMHSLFAHNWLLQILSETGLPGLCLFLCLALSALRWMKSVPLNPTQKGLMAGISAAFFQNTVDCNLIGPANWLLFAWGLGLACPAKEISFADVHGQNKFTRKILIVLATLLIMDFSSRPGRSHHWVQQGLSDLARGRWDHVVNDLRRARQLDPTSLEGLSLSVRLQTELWKKGGSVSHLEQAGAELNNWRRIPATGKLWTELAVAWAKAGRRDRATGCLRNAAAVNPLFHPQ